MAMKANGVTQSCSTGICQPSDHVQYLNSFPWCNCRRFSCDPVWLSCFSSIMKLDNAVTIWHQILSFILWVISGELNLISPSKAMLCDTLRNTQTTAGEIWTIFTTMLGWLISKDFSWQEIDEIYLRTQYLFAVWLQDTIYLHGLLQARLVSKIPGQGKNSSMKDCYQWDLTLSPLVLFPSGSACRHGCAKHWVLNFAGGKFR